MSIELTDEGKVLSLPFDPEQVCYVRVTQADLSRMWGVTRAAVSHWVKQGKITVFADGRIDPNRAASELVKNCNVQKLRAKPFRPLRLELDHVRGQLKSLVLERDALAARVQALEEGLRHLVRRYLESEQVLADFGGRVAEAVPEELAGAALDAAVAGAVDAPMGALAARMDPDVRALLAELVPELVATMAQEVEQEQERAALAELDSAWHAERRAALANVAHGQHFDRAALANVATWQHFDREGLAADAPL